MGWPCYHQSRNQKEHDDGENHIFSYGNDQYSFPYDDSMGQPDCFWATPRVPIHPGLPIFTL